YRKDPDSDSTVASGHRLRILILPMVTGTILMAAIYFLFGENGIFSQIGSFLPASLGGLFVVWAFAQGRFFGLATMRAITVPSGGQSSADGYSPIPSLVMTSTLVVVLTLAVTEGFRFFLGGSSFTVWPYLFSFAVYGLCIYVTWGQRRKAAMHSTTHTVARKWFWATQLFITWHVLSIFRSIDNTFSEPVMFIEELFLMIVTVFLAIWALTSKGEGSKSTLFTEDNALFWGVAFGYAYAGSVAMVTSVMEDVKYVLIGGHILVVATVMWSQRSMLESKIERINSDRGIAESVEHVEINNGSNEVKLQAGRIQTDESDSVPEEPVTDEQSIGDPVDWSQQDESLGDSTTWDDEIELLD
ncbi:MAG: hypothetical protein MKZ54_05080, partial [Candidatus Poseidoniaceae archaeon]|nr:hypothetical protein [Candidatus Poseidoniaceae archaeon]